MPILARVAETVPTRPCRFCLALQDDSVFADFDVDDKGRVLLRRISFDGFGCCEGDFKKMNADDSRALITSVEQGAVEDSKVEMVLRSYFRENVELIWDDALATHELL